MKTKVTIATRRTIPTAFPRGEIPRGGGKEKRERETAGGFLQGFGQRGARAGHRSAQDLTRCYPSALCGPRSADGGTAGGSADDRILLLASADCGAPRRHSSSWSWLAEFSSSRFSSRTEFNNAAVFQETESGLWSRSFVFPVKSFKISAQDRVRQRLRLFILQLVRMMTPMSLVMCFFALFPMEKSAECRAGPH